MSIETCTDEKQKINILLDRQGKQTSHIISHIILRFRRKCKWLWSNPWKNKWRARVSMNRRVSINIVVVIVRLRPDADKRVLSFAISQTCMHCPTTNKSHRVTDMRWLVSVWYRNDKSRSSVSGLNTHYVGQNRVNALHQSTRHVLRFQLESVLVVCYSCYAYV